MARMTIKKFKESGIYKNIEADIDYIVKHCDDIDIEKDIAFSVVISELTTYEEMLNWFFGTDYAFTNNEYFVGIQNRNDTSDFLYIRWKNKEVETND